MANRRQGYGNRSYYNSGPVNPWQGGNVPGGNPQGGSFNSVNPTSLISQLSEPQAQLALALSKLLQPQQQVPSLLTMDTVNPLHNTGGYRPNNDYSQRGRIDMHRRPRHDFKRNEPYNKMNSRNTRDTDFNRRRDNSSKSSERKIQPHRTTIVAKRSKTSSAKITPKSPGKVTEVKPVKEDTAEADSADTSVKESDGKRDESETEDKKRDWKEEKSGEDEDEPVKEEKQEDATIEEEQEEEDEEEEKNNEESSREKSPSSEKPAASKYDGIPKELLQCRICQKSMWDGESFEKHMNGRTHQQMFEKVEESYRINADMMREQIRLAEEKNTIEMMRMKRLGKKMKTQQVSRCAMCDLQFEGQLFIHRKSAGHQKLKHFLHPQCNYCKKEFPTRMEWENHRHTPEHFRKKAECLEKKEKKKHDNDILLEENNFTDIDLNETEEEEDVNALTDLPEDMSEIKNRIPVYNSKRSVGMSLILPASGFHCKPCYRFFLTEEQMQNHARTKLHYKTFTDILKEKLDEYTEKKRKPMEEDDEGNWKRRKVAKDEKIDESNVDDSKRTAVEDGSELYDPADSFMSSDPNDVCLPSDTSKDCIGNEDDEVWKEVDRKLDEILDLDDNKSKDVCQLETENTSTPAKNPNNRNTTNTATRRTRAKKN